MVICNEELLIKDWNHSSFLWDSYQNYGAMYHWIIYVGRMCVARIWKKYLKNSWKLLTLMTCTVILDNDVKE